MADGTGAAERPEPPIAAGKLIAMAELDGRVARRRRNREAVIEAAVSLMQEGVLDPSVEQITVRSGVSPRSVFRYFESLDEMRRAVLLATIERSAPLIGPDEPGGALEERVRQVVGTRLALFEQVAGAARAARLREAHVPTIAEDLGELRRRQRSQLRSAFRPELERRSEEDAEQVAALVEVLLSFEAWDLLSRVQHRDGCFIRSLWERVLLAALCPPGSTNGARHLPEEQPVSA